MHTSIVRKANGEFIIGGLYWLIADYWEEDVIIPILLKGVDRNLLIYYTPLVGHSSLWKNPASKEIVFRTRNEARTFIATNGFKDNDPPHTR